jgi:formylglycine-generating enzyme required for sulfatase activity
VRISQPFILGRCEVTVGQFRQFVFDTGYETEGEQEVQVGQSLDGTEPKAKKQEWTWRQPGFAQDDNDPVVCVSWSDAAAYCEWLAHKEGMTYRLPTEAEWEYACRAGSTTDSFFGSQESLDQYAWFDGNSQGHTHPVGEKNPNAWGLYDMYGNVWEWCGDWQADGYYNSSPVADPRGPTSGSSRVRRGGGWNFPDTFCRSAFRNGLVPGSRVSFLGFRVAALPFTK